MTGHISGGSKLGALAGVALMALVMGVTPALATDITSLSAKLNGASETAGGDTDGSGTFTAQLDPDSGDLCYTLGVKGVGAPTMAHIHKGAAGADGDVVVKLNITTDGDECAALQRELAKAIVAAPSAYYVNVHNAEFPKGAVRGQLNSLHGAGAAAREAVPEAAVAPSAPAPAATPAPADSAPVAPATL